MLFCCCTYLFSNKWNLSAKNKIKMGMTKCSFLTIVPFRTGTTRVSKAVVQKYRVVGISGK